MILLPQCHGYTSSYLQFSASYLGGVVEVSGIYKLLFVVQCQLSRRCGRSIMDIQAPICSLVPVIQEVWQKYHGYTSSYLQFSASYLGGVVEVSWIYKLLFVVQCQLSRRCGRSIMDIQAPICSLVPVIQEVWWKYHGYTSSYLQFSASYLGGVVEVSWIYKLLFVVQCQLSRRCGRSIMDIQAPICSLTASYLGGVVEVSWIYKLLFVVQCQLSRRCGRSIMDIQAPICSLVPVIQEVWQKYHGYTSSYLQFSASYLGGVVEVSWIYKLLFVVQCQLSRRCGRSIMDIQAPICSLVPVIQEVWQKYHGYTSSYLQFSASYLGGVVEVSWIYKLLFVVQCQLSRRCGRSIMDIQAPICSLVLVIQEVWWKYHGYTSSYLQFSASYLGGVVEVSWIYKLLFVVQCQLSRRCGRSIMDIQAPICSLVPVIQEVWQKYHGYTSSYLQFSGSYLGGVVEVSWIYKLLFVVQCQLSRRCGRSIMDIQAPICSLVPVIQEVWQKYHGYTSSYLQFSASYLGGVVEVSWIYKLLFVVYCQLSRKCGRSIMDIQAPICSLVPVIQEVWQKYHGYTSSYLQFSASYLGGVVEVSWIYKLLFVVQCQLSRRCGRSIMDIQAPICSLVPVIQEVWQKYHGYTSSYLQFSASYLGGVVEVSWIYKLLFVVQCQLSRRCGGSIMDIQAPICSLVPVIQEVWQKYHGYTSSYLQFSASYLGGVVEVSWIYKLLFVVQCQLSRRCGRSIMDIQAPICSLLLVIQEVWQKYHGYTSSQFSASYLGVEVSWIYKLLVYQLSRRCGGSIMDIQAPICSLVLVIQEVWQKYHGYTSSYLQFSASYLGGVVEVSWIYKLLFVVQCQLSRRCGRSIMDIQAPICSLVPVIQEVWQKYHGYTSSYLQFSASYLGGVVEVSWIYKLLFVVQCQLSRRCGRSIMDIQAPICSLVPVIQEVWWKYHGYTSSYLQFSASYLGGVVEVSWIYKLLFVVQCQLSRRCGRSIMDIQAPICSLVPVIQEVWQKCHGYTSSYLQFSASYLGGVVEVSWIYKLLFVVQCQLSRRCGRSIMDIQAPICSLVPVIQEVWWKYHGYTSSYLQFSASYLGGVVEVSWIYKLLFVVQCQLSRRCGRSIMDIQAPICSLVPVIQEVWQKYHGYTSSYLQFSASYLGGVVEVSWIYKLLFVVQCQLSRRCGRSIMDIQAPICSLVPVIQEVWQKYHGYTSSYLQFSASYLGGVWKYHGYTSSYLQFSASYLGGVVEVSWIYKLLFVVQCQLSRRCGRSIMDIQAPICSLVLVIQEVWQKYHGYTSSYLQFSAKLSRRCGRSIMDIQAPICSLVPVIQEVWQKYHGYTSSYLQFSASYLGGVVEVSWIYKLLFVVQCQLSRRCGRSIMDIQAPICSLVPVIQEVWYKLLFEVSWIYKLLFVVQCQLSRRCGRSVWIYKLLFVVQCQLSRRCGRSIRDIQAPICSLVPVIQEVWQKCHGYTSSYL